MSEELPEYNHPPSDSVEWWKENLRSHMCIAFAQLGCVNPTVMANGIIKNLEMQALLEENKKREQ